MAAEPPELRAHWPVVFACFCIAVFTWGYGFYGQSVYLAELRGTWGWGAAVATGATTATYLGGATLMPFLPDAMARFGPRAVLLGGVALLGVGAILFAHATTPWFLFVAAVPMAIGWATATGPAIAITMGYWFDRQRPLALSLALNGASASGFIVAPLLVGLAQALALPGAVLISVLGFWLLLVPIIFLCIGAPPRRPGTATNGATTTDPRPALASRAAALRDPGFRSVALPFALALGAQVGFIVHIVSFLLPGLGPGGTSLAVSLASIAAMLGRIAAGFTAHRLRLRPFAALSFAVQAAGLLLMYTWPTETWALYIGSLLFGVSVGNVITLPAMVIQREFAAGSYAMLVGLNGAIGQFALSVGPLLFGVMRDATGSYGAVILLCVTAQLLGSALIPRR